MSFEEAMIINHGRNRTIWTSPEAQERMQHKVYDNNYQTTIPIIPHAHQSIYELHIRKPFVCYITARPESILEGTQQRLRKHNFPDLPIIAKPVSVPREQEHTRKI